MDAIKSRHNLEEMIEKTIVGPAGNLHSLMKVLKEYDFQEVQEGAVEIRDFVKPLKPNESLKAYRLRENLTQSQLADKAGIMQQHISEMENDKRVIGKKNASKFAAILNCDYRHFL